MPSLFARRLQVQLLLILLAGLCVMLLSVILISDALRGAENVVIADTGKALGGAIAELEAQLADRVSLESGWADLPLPTRDIALRGVSQAVLRSYPGIEGGYFERGEFLGYSFPTHNNPASKTDLPAAERQSISETVDSARTTGSTARRTLRGATDVIVIEAKVGPEPAQATWAMKRIAGLADPAQQYRRWMLAALVLAALLGVAGTLYTAVGLQWGVESILRGLRGLGEDFEHQLPETGHELGEIARAINRMSGERARLEAELRRDDKLKAMGRLVAGIAHEIRNPLNGIRLSMQVLERNPSPETVTMVIEEVDRLESLLRTLLMFDPGRSPELTHQSVLPIIQQAVRLLLPQAKLKNVGISIQPAVSDVVAAMDAAGLHQVLTNLLLNALDGVGPDGHVSVVLASECESVTIRVRDSGPGVPAEFEPRLFEAFSTTKSGGAGLGLAVSRELIRNMGGKLEYEGNRPMTTFTVTLPAHTYAIA